MSIWEWALIAASALISYPLWTFLHEASHVLVASLMSPLKEVRWWLYPHRDEAGSFFFARVQWLWESQPTHNKWWWAALYSAPRAMNLIASVFFPLSFLFETPWSFAWMILWGAGLIDFFVGSIGRSEHSDLRRTASVLSFDPIVLRALGFCTISTSTVFGLLANIFLG
jgi:hypothetical protein